MSMLYRADDPRTVVDPMPAGAVAGQIDATGVYLTDEVFLYRVVGMVASGVGEVVELEDCYWLDVVHVQVRDLRARQLRVVTPAADSRLAAH